MVTPDRENNIYEKCLELALNIVEEAKLGYPLLRRAIFIESLLGYIGVDKKILGKYHFQRSAEKKYESLYKRLKKVDIDKYVKFLTSKK